MGLVLDKLARNGMGPKFRILHLAAMAAMRLNEEVSLTCIRRIFIEGR